MKERQVVNAEKGKRVEGCMNIPFQQVPVALTFSAIYRAKSSLASFPCAPPTPHPALTPPREREKKMERGMVTRR